jgi:hypothetical protein
LCVGIHVYMCTYVYMCVCVQTCVCTYAFVIFHLIVNTLIKKIYIYTYIHTYNKQVKLSTAKSSKPGRARADLPIVLAKLRANKPSSTPAKTDSHKKDNEPSTPRSNGSSHFAQGSTPGKPEPERCLVIYGHYDVAFANIDHDWKSDPWRLTGRDGFLYGRGVSDDKGPVLACLYAAYELYQAGNLGMDLVFVIEGEEESGYSLDERSFPDFVKENQHWFKGCKVTAFCCFDLRGLRRCWVHKVLDGLTHMYLHTCVCMYAYDGLDSHVRTYMCMHVCI